MNKNNIPPIEDVAPLYNSKRVMESEELRKLSKHIGLNWKQIGVGLKFKMAQLDQFEKDTNCMSDAVDRMLFRWLNWRDKKATVGRLTMVLLEHKEYDAIKCLTK